MTAPAETFHYQPHPRIAERAATPPPKIDDEHVGFNGRLAALITKGVGNMWAFYAVALAMGLWMAGLGASLFGDAYPRSLMLLVFGGIVQMLLMIAIMVGQQVLGQAADKRATQTYKDAEAILHECQQIQAHLNSQDKLRGRPAEPVVRDRGPRGEEVGSGPCRYSQSKQPRVVPQDGGAHPTYAGSALDLDQRAHDQRTVAGEAEVFGGVGGDLRSRDKETLAPARHTRCIANLKLDRREKIGGLIDLQRALEPSRRGEAKGARHIWLIHVAEAGRNMGDSVIGVAEVIDDQALGQGARGGWARFRSRGSRRAREVSGCARRWRASPVAWSSCLD